MNTKVLPSGEDCMSGIDVVKGLKARNLTIKKNIDKFLSGQF